MNRTERNRSRRKIIIGARYGYLRVLSVNNEEKETRYECACDCGKIAIVRGSPLMKGFTKSCGCQTSALRLASRGTHGMSKRPETRKTFNVWRYMRYRCENKNDKAFHSYGGRGIKICDRWQRFENFVADMGIAEPGMTLDRINNDGPYSPENCRWATRKEQANNRRTNVLLTAKGKTQNIRQWSEETGLQWSTIFYRLKRGWDIERAVTP